ncbi:MAG: phosphatase PAP2 family protein [Faecousia sp.]
MNQRLSTTRNFNYLWFWPIFGLRYLLIESYCPPGGYHVVSCALDARIPFCEVFVIPYLLWHVCMMGMHLWLCFQDGKGCRQYFRYLMVTMSISTAVFLLWPTCQNLRPASFPRDNFLTKVAAQVYRMDTNTNVCPSEHVIGSVGLFLAAWHCDKLKTPRRLIMIGAIACLTAVATVFLKQHSVLDILAALPVCMVGYVFAYADRSGSFWTICGKLRRQLHLGHSTA